MRLLYLLTTLGIGGAERQALSLAECMARRGHQVSVLVLRSRCNDQWPTALPTEFLNMSRSPWPFFRGMMRGQRALSAFRPDLIHSHTYPANMAARLLIPFLPRTRLVATIHNVREGGWGRSLAYRLTDRLVAATTAVSQDVANRVLADRSVPAGKCRVLCNAFDLRALRPDSARRRRLREAMQTGGNFIWLAAGRLTPAKDYPNLLRAFARLRVSWPQTELWIAGEGESYFLRVLQTLAGQQNLQQSVRWLGLRKDLPELLDAADGFVLASAWEGMPLVIGEAMAMEKNVVATDVGGVRELLGACGSIVPPHAPEALAAAMSELMHWPREERQAVGKSARRRIEESFSMERMADRWEEFYRGIVAEGRGQRTADS
jgi:glycosyltransferase involved in cell wall biosynthesis